MNELEVLIAGQLTGVLTQDESGSLSFAYDDIYTGVPLSLSMPVSNKIFADKTARPFLFGLLPDSPGVRRSLGRRYGVSGNNPFDLLSHIGLDCPGAVQFCSPDNMESAARKEQLIPLSEEEIARRLSRGQNDRQASWETDKEHWSLGGQQSKFALREENNRWYSCEGAAATTHIFKPGIPDLKLEALNEFVCIKAAKCCGLPAVSAEYATFCEAPAIIITRYDRTRLPNDSIARLHQEDFCQALGVLPESKYTEEGGPGASDIINLCKITGSPSAANIVNFADMLFFNYLIGAPDAHAKNYSLLLDRNAAYLAPLYDVASMIPYTERPFDIKLAMGIAGENRVGRIENSALSQPE